MSGEDAPLCFLCGRPLGRRTERHHPVPRSRGGRETVPVHPICHRTIHRTLSNKALERDYAAPEALRGHPEIARFISWIAGKDPDFHAPTRKPKS
ncbi:MAG: HNH endonuclease [Alphaproteobacteria bacterium]|nr:HNH endonuclease [Alphaproteobacteria bacterium]MBV9371785.1 HNH endonuclease [Alphaproteobacteria bacterium]MBV9901930.1 HNH endonuclease [Alphaproteobacteria bacterium]